jgi:hypothetical protein
LLLEIVLQSLSQKMARIVSHLLVALIIALPAVASNSLTYKPYVNLRFGYSVQYPADLLIAQGESDNSDGQRFVSKNGDESIRQQTETYCYSLNQKLY